MASSELRQRHVKPDLAQAPLLNAERTHPAGPIKHGLVKQILRACMFAAYFNGSCFIILISQIIGSPLYVINKDYFYAWVALTKQHFGLVLVNMTWWWAPTKMRVSWDKSLEGQFKKTEDGRLETNFPERMVLIANHQIYTDWIYLWWTAYTSRMHGHIFIILKEVLKFIPIIGQGMMFYGFIFLSRKWATDEARFKYRINKLNTRHRGPLSGSQSLDPVWLLIFPEGTNMSKNGRINSKKWAEKTGVEDLQHLLLPRHTGLQYCLQGLNGTLDWIYDCTLVYEGIPEGEYGQDIFTLRSTYLEGRPPKSVNMHWRRFSVADIPVNDTEAFSKWLAERWREKDALLQYYVQHNRFPGGSSGDSSDLTNENIVPNGSTVPRKAVPGVFAEDKYHIETEVKPVHPLEFLQIFAPTAALLFVINVAVKFLRLLRTTVGL